MGTAPVALSGQTSFALVDGNSFYCSCERVFDPKLEKRPVIVLSNNDTCAIARTDEAKALGITMGKPWFQIKDICQRHNVAALSSNYALYGDMSRRLNEVYGRFSPDVEVYSIDESFIDLAPLRLVNRLEWGADLRATVNQWTGIPTCVGIGPTKTLAKIANRMAKGALGGVCDLTNPLARTEALARFPIRGVWGLGEASAQKLERLGIETAEQLRTLDPRIARSLLTVIGERMVRELDGQSCIAIETLPPMRKGCMVTRAFGHRITAFPEMAEAVASYAVQLGEKLRRHGLATNHLTVFIQTCAHDPGPHRAVSSTMLMQEVTNDTLMLVKAAGQAIHKIWKPGYRYYKAGVMTYDLVPPKTSQRSLFDDFSHERAEKIMTAMDTVNARFGRNTVVPAAVGIKQGWTTRHEKRSPRYTTRWDEMPTAL